MLANVLAVLLGLGSLIFYLSGFLYPEVHRRADFVWGGLGLIYAGVLWFSAGQMTGLVMLGQLMAVSLLLGLGWQTLSVRREKTSVYQQTPIVLTPEVVSGWAKSKLNSLRIAPDENVRPVRLERRAVEGVALGNRLDPRRRPAYDYEFVEDGVALDDGQLSLAERFAGDREAEESAGAGDLDELAYAAPPSAEAEVITEVQPLERIASETAADLSIEAVAEGESAVDEVFEAIADGAVLEAAISEEALTEAIDAEALSIDEVVQQESTKALSGDDLAEGADAVLEKALAEDFEWDGDPTEVELESRGVDRNLVTANDGRVLGAAPDISKNELAQPATTDISCSQGEAARSSDWIDDGDWAESAEESVAGNPLARTAVGKKPSLLATPLILVGWVKDVVASLTKPKPSKPVIVIPRREPAADIQRLEPDEPGGRSPVPTARQPVSEPEEDNWEESNWDD